MSNEINQISNLVRGLIVLLTIPLILIGCIYISYGEVFDGIIAQETNPYKLYQLQVQLAIFDNSYLQYPTSTSPKITALIGYNSILVIYIVFSIWLVLFAISTYLKLSQRVDSKFIILLKSVLILVIYVVSISPDLPLWLSLIGYLIISVILVMLLLYWVYALKTKH